MQAPLQETLAAGIVIAYPQRDVHLDTLSPLRVRVETKRSREDDNCDTDNSVEDTPPK